MSSPKKSILIIGVGSIGERHLRCFQATGKVDVSACDPNAGQGKKISEKYNCPWYASLDEALGKGRFDAAVICSPANMHIPMAKQCANHGLHLFVEKPLAITLDGIEELQRLVKEKRNVVRVAYTHRSIAPHFKALEFLKAGKIGRPVQVVVVAGHHFPTARPAYRDVYFKKHETGGGAIQDALTHVVHAVEWLVSPVRSVFAYADHLVLDGVDVEDAVNMTTRLENGAIASFALNLFQPTTEISITIHGTKGSVRSEFHNMRAGIVLLGETEWQWHDLPREERDGIFVRQAESFLAALEGKEDGLATLDDGLQTLKVNIAALESAATHREVKV